MSRETDSKMLCEFSGRVIRPTKVWQPRNLIQRLITPRWRSEQHGPDTVHTGYYWAWDLGQLRRVAVPGRIVVRDGHVAGVFVGHPPDWLRRHPKGSCLQLLAPGSEWFRMHWNRGPLLMETARAYMNDMIAEALQLSRSAGM